VQTPDTQSVGTRQLLLSAHLGQVLPPQSTSVSSPFFTLSVQEVVQTPPLQAPDAQSVPALHDLPMPQAVQAPPQSTSVSVPFFTLSVQLALAHFPEASQIPLMQSPAALQAPPAEHLGQVSPQSTSVSLPFFTLSVQLGARHTPLWQTLLLQS